MKCEQKADIFKRNPPTLAHIQELTLCFILNGNKQSNLLFYNLPIVSDLGGLFSPVVKYSLGNLCMTLMNRKKQKKQGTSSSSLAVIDHF